MPAGDEQERLVLEAGKDTGELASFIANNLTDELLDTVEIERTNAQDSLLSDQSP
jgi:hypothetical protein